MTSTASAQESAVPRPLAVVTGASSGIGLALAREFAEHGFDLVVAAEDEAIAEVPDALAGTGTQVTPVRADLSTGAGVEQLCAVVEGLGPVEVLALNAGVGTHGDFTREVPLEADLELIALNVTSPVHLAKRLLPGMVERGEGRVLVTSSVAATMPGPYYATYAASKAFLQSFAQAIRYELRDTGVTVTALQPGPTDTDFFQRAGMQDARVDQGPKADPADVARTGYEALMDGKDHVVAGGPAVKGQVAGSRFLPETARAALHARQVEPGSAES